MANRYANLTPSKDISQDFRTIDVGFDKVQADVDAKAATVNSHIANADIHVTKADKTKWDGHVANADIHVTAAQKAAWDAKADGGTATELADHVADQVVHVTQADHDKLDGIEEGAQVNQNAFAKVNDIVAADPSSQFYIVGGIGITVTTNPINGEITVTATGDAAPGAHGSTHTEHGADPIPTATLTEGGLLSAAQLAEIVAHGELLDEHAVAITALEDRLDDAETADVTLQSGLQVVTAAKDARFKLGEIRGRTEINGQGRIGLIGVENPYVIATSGNLLPPFYEWGLSSAQIVDKYYAHLKSTVGDAMSYRVKFEPGETYTYSAEHTGSIAVNAWDANGGLVGGKSLVGYTQEQSVTFEVPVDTAILDVYFSNFSDTGDILPDVTILNPMLVIGTEPKPFEPQCSSMLAWQTELHSNPEDGSDPDVLFEQDEKYLKLEKWKKVVLDGSLDWKYNAKQTGYKEVYCDIPSGDSLGLNTSFITNYNGTLVARAYPTTAGDQFYGLGGSSPRRLFLSISNTDSGWGDNYSPDADEIKACMDGYKMYQEGSRETPYTSGKRQWFKISKPSDPSVAVLPTKSYPEWTPSQLLYRLAKENVEPVPCEGCLTLVEGDNTVEVGTGVVLRERANPVKTINSDGYYRINSNVNASSDSTLKNKTNNIAQVYRDSREDFKWTLISDVAASNGGAVARIPYADYDQSAAYSVTYLKLDKSPIAPITGSLATNEKAQLSDLTAGVAEALHGVSVLQMKKAEKDAPGWITPTMLNGWVNVSSAFYNAQYRKDSQNRIEIVGAVMSGTVGYASVFVLPAGYRPGKRMEFPILTYDGTNYVLGAVEIKVTGEVQIFKGGNNLAFLDGIPLFTAEL